MIFNIFQLNWILIDLVIIALLIIVLISVKLFKLKFRWRKNLSNEDLEFLNFNFSEIELQKQQIIIKKMFYLKNKKSEDKRKSKKVCIFLFPKKDRKLVYILAEGLASYEYTVVFLNVAPKSNNKINTEQMSKEINNLILTILKYLKIQEIKIDFKCLIISFSSIISLYYFNDSDPNISKLILINPTLKKKLFKKNDEKEIFNQKTLLKTYLVFSEKSRFFLKNRSLKNCLNRNSRYHNNLLYIKTIEKTKASFKYYETILLGVLIELIQKESSNI